jgi:cold shock CspA family protein
VARAGLPPRPAEHGNVVEYDAGRGLGMVEAEDGRRLLFHCTQTVDGSRAIRVGAAVRYEVAAGALGTWEAVAVALSDA